MVLHCRKYFAAHIMLLKTNCTNFADQILLYIVVYHLAFYTEKGLKWTKIVENGQKK